MSTEVHAVETLYDVSLVNRITNTAPLIVHAHGPLHQQSVWPRIREALFTTPRRHVALPPELTLITCNNGAHAMGLFEQSAERLGLPYRVAGHGLVPWVNSRDKPASLAQALETIDTEFVLYADSRDAAIIGDPAPALERFRNWQGCDLLFGGDRINWPTLPRFRSFEMSLPDARTTEFRFLNGGVWIGRTSFCREFFHAALTTPPAPEMPDSEQGILKELFPRFYPRMQLDYRCEIIQNIGFLFKDIFDIHTEPS